MKATALSPLMHSLLGLLLPVGKKNIESIGVPKVFVRVMGGSDEMAKLSKGQHPTQITMEFIRKGIVQDFWTLSIKTRRGVVVDELEVSTGDGIYQLDVTALPRGLYELHIDDGVKRHQCFELIKMS